MRNWVIQPGSLITHWETLPYAGLTILGALSLTATVASMFYTTASDAMVSPKLKHGKWEDRELQGFVRTSYANVNYVKEECPALLEEQDEDNAGISCMSMQFSGQSFQNLLAYMSMWEGIESGEDLSNRPVGTTLLHDNTTLEASWIEMEHSDVAAQFEETGRIVNNVTLAMPHPGLSAAATLEINKILQPADLGGTGEYTIHAGVVSPTVNVMCVEMTRSELEPLVYTAWDDARTVDTGVGSQRIGVEDWEDDVPKYEDGDGDPNWLNSTDVDDIFRWGESYGRRPPVFRLVSSHSPAILRVCTMCIMPLSCSNSRRPRSYS